MLSTAPYYIVSNREFNNNSNMHSDTITVIIIIITSSLFYAFTYCGFFIHCHFWPIFSFILIMRKKFICEIIRDNKFSNGSRAYILKILLRWSPIHNNLRHFAKANERKKYVSNGDRKNKKKNAKLMKKSVKNSREAKFTAKEETQSIVLP